MPKIYYIILLIAIGLSFTIPNKIEQDIVPTNFSIAESQYKLMIQKNSDPFTFPRSSNPDGSIKNVNTEDWTVGFWPGALWSLYEYTHKEEWKQAAIRWTETLEKNQFLTNHHDIGFMMYCSYGNGYRLTKNEKYKAVLIQSAKSLCKRYNEKVGCIKSWDEKLSWDGTTILHYPVIIDNMMNLELLFYAAKVTGDTIYRHIAIKHAETTMKNHLRNDFSSYHVVNYDSATGKVVSKETNQGYANNSTWARGQSWGIYGFTMLYRETKDQRFLATAQKMADYLINNKNLPADKIPNWDFNVNEPSFIPPVSSRASQMKHIPRDVSAAAITASALIELSGYLGNTGLKYKNTAIQILQSLSTERYLASVGTNNHFLLKHSVGSIPHGFEVDEPLIYADYYFLEALLRWKKM